MEMLLLLEVHTEKQESKITSCNRGDTVELFDGESGAQLERGQERFEDLCLCRCSELIRTRSLATCFKL